MHADLRDHVIELFGIVPSGPDDPLILSERAMRPNPEDPADRRLVCMAPNSIVLMFGQMYGELGLAGCSSHSGRRTSSRGSRTRSQKPAARCGTFSSLPGIPA